MKALNGFSLACVLMLAGWYGYAHSMTEEGFFVQGYIGTVWPVALCIAAFCFGMSLAYANKSEAA